MKMVPLSELSRWARVQLSALLGFLLVLQVPAVQAAIEPHIARYPHVSLIFGILCTAVTTLQTPVVQRTLGLSRSVKVEEMPDGEKTTTETTKVVALADGVEASGSLKQKVTEQEQEQGSTAQDSGPASAGDPSLPSAKQPGA